MEKVLLCCNDVPRNFVLLLIIVRYLFLEMKLHMHLFRLTEYTIESRNLLKLSDYSKNLKLLYQGSDAILATICRLPRSEHDPYSFAVDFVHSVSTWSHYVHCLLG
jgi:hypothetical protein